MKIRLRELREGRGLSLKQVGIRFGISKSAVSHYENERRDIPNEYLCEFANYFGTTTDFILGRETEK